MDGITIQKILNSNQKTSQIFRGCFPCDLLPNPKTLQYPAALIINLDSHKYEGSHWVATYARGIDKEVIYFDSLSLPIIENIQNFLRFFPKIIKNSRPFQNPLFNTCAHYCIVFVYYISIGHNFDEFLNFLSRCQHTDFFVREIVNNIFEIE